MKDSFADNLSEDLRSRITDICKRAYHALNMRCYARFDIRVTPESKVYIIEANANPSLEKTDELAKSAEKVGISYSKLIQKILNLAFQRNR